MYEVWSNMCGWRKLHGSYTRREDAEKAVKTFDRLLNPEGYREYDLEIVEV